MTYRLLIVDDEKWMCEALLKLIPQLDALFSVAGVARNGSQAMALLERESFDAVITDIQMPKVDGLELLRDLRAKGVELPVIIVTGFDEFEYARLALRHGAMDYLLKPIDRDQIRQTLQKLKVFLNCRFAESVTPEQSVVQAMDWSNGTTVVENILQLVQQSYMEDLSISDIADKSNYNFSYLSRLFKQETGKGFVQYLTEVRMEKATELLTSTRYNVSEVARMVGYWDDKHFSRTFKRELGESPTDYRKRDQRT